MAEAIKGLNIKLKCTCCHRFYYYNCLKVIGLVGKLKEAFSAVDGALKDVITISFATEKYDEKISGLKFDLDILEEKVKSIVAEKAI